MLVDMIVVGLLTQVVAAPASLCQRICLNTLRFMKMKRAIDLLDVVYRAAGNLGRLVIDQPVK